MKEFEEQSWLCGQLVMEAHDAIILADQEGIIRLWNKGAEIIFGFSPVEAIGQSLHIIIPENLRERHDRGYHKVIQSGETKYSNDLLAVPALTKTGNRVSVEFTMILLRDDQGRVLGAAAIIRDVSARWEKERAMKHRLADMEA
jgi:PAS domain S-box-containing protein